MNMLQHVQSPVVSAPAICNTIVSRAISELIISPTNPRRHSPRQIRQLARSIQTFGYNVPILINDQSQILAGHGRLLACQSLGWTEIPTITLDHITPAQARAFVIADNRLAEVASWDGELLAQEFHALAHMDLDFSLDITGFDTAEIDLFIQGISDTEKSDSADEIPSDENAPRVCVLGDLFILGKHRILCGDALDAVNYHTLLGRQRAAMVFSDPPFNVPMDGHATGLGAIRHREFLMASGEMNKPEFTGFLTRAFENLARYSVDGSLHYLCIDWRHFGEMGAAGEAVYSELKNICVWVKDNGGMGSLYRSQHEMVFVWKSGTAPHQNHIQLGQFGRNRSNVWKYPGANSFSRSSGEGNLLALHPTVKPVALIADALLDASRRGEIVLDPFAGSGSTILAAERVGRIGYGMELDPRYVDTTIRRWQTITGDEAIHAESGRSFNAISSERGASHG